MTNYIFVKVGLQALLSLRTELYAYLQSLSLKFHDARRSADSSFRVAYDSQAIQTIYNKGFTNIFGSVITLIGTFFIMVRLDWAADPAVARHRAPDRGRDLFLCPSDSDGINLHPGTGKRRARAGAGRLERDPNGARLRSGRFRGLANFISARSKVCRPTCASPSRT